MSILYREKNRRHDAARALLPASEAYESVILEIQNSFQEPQEQPKTKRDPGVILFMQYSSSDKMEELSAFLLAFMAALGSLESLAGTCIKESTASALRIFSGVSSKQIHL